MRKKFDPNINTYLVFNDYKQEVAKENPDREKLNKLQSYLQEKDAVLYYAALALKNKMRENYDKAFRKIAMAYTILPGKCYRKFKTKIPKNEDVMIKVDKNVLEIYADLLIITQRYREAEIYIEVLRQTSPDKVKYFKMLFYALFKANDFDVAEYYFNLFFKNFAYACDSEIIKMYVETLIAKSEFKKANNVLDVLKSGLSEENYYMLKGKVVLAEDNPDKEEVIKIAGSMPESTWENLEAKGDLYSKIAMFKTASYYYNRAAIWLLKSTDNSAKVGQIILNAVEAAMNAGDQDIADAIVEKAKEEVVDFTLMYNLWIDLKRKKKTS